jgi:DNA repair protein RadC
MHDPKDDDDGLEDSHASRDWGGSDPDGTSRDEDAKETRPAAGKTAPRKRTPAKGRKAEQPHYRGHRERLRERVLERGAESLADYEVLEFLLFGARANGDTKPLAKALLRHFGSVSAVLAAEPAELREVSGVGPAITALMKVTREAARRMAREEARERTVISSWDRLLTYCRVELGHEKVEQFHLLFLDKKHQLIADEAQNRGTVDHTPVYPREVVKRAMHYNASAIIMVHNHPSGDATPSKADVQMTKTVIAAARSVGINVHDHVIITPRSHTSLKNSGFI